MRHFSCLLPLPLLIALFCTSCGDDPKLVEKREKQKAEIVRLRGELALIEAKLTSLPPDVSVQLEETRKLAGRQAEEVAALEAEVAGLESRKRELQGEFDAYKAKYQVK